MDGQRSPSTPMILRIARSFGLARGIGRRPAVGPRPSQPLVLFGFEGCRHCRRVREVLSELEIDFIHRACPVGGTNNRAELVERGGKAQVPYLIDPNAGVELYESEMIVRHLLDRYGAPRRVAAAASSAPVPELPRYPFM